MFLQLTNVSSGYGPIRVIWDVSLEIQNDREIVALIGPNGAGKSTLLRTISGLLGVRKGSISFRGRHICNLAPHEIANLGIAHVLEGRRLFGPLTVYENLLCGLYLKRRNLDKNSKEQLFQSVFELFPILRERRHQPAQTLSGGEGQMLAIGTVLMFDPTLLLIDEPSLGLAPLVVNSLTQALRSINKKGTSILLVEQKSRLALDLASKIYVLETGRVVLGGTAHQLSADPRIKEIYLG